MEFSPSVFSDLIFTCWQFLPQITAFNERDLLWILNWTFCFCFRITFSELFYWIMTVIFSALVLSYSWFHRHRKEIQWSNCILCLNKCGKAILKYHTWLFFFLISCDLSPVKIYINWYTLPRLTSRLTSGNETDLLEVFFINQTSQQNSSNWFYSVSMKLDYLLYI